MNFKKFLRTPFFTEHLWRLLLDVKETGIIFIIIFMRRVFHKVKFDKCIKETVVYTIMELFCENI